MYGLAARRDDSVSISVSHEFMGNMNRQNYVRTGTKLQRSTTQRVKLANK